MNSRKRLKRLSKIVKQIEELHSEWQCQEQSKVESHVIVCRRERLKTLEIEIASIRLMQSENRLYQQVILAILSFIGGSVLTNLWHFLN